LNCPESSDLSCSLAEQIASQVLLCHSVFLRCERAISKDKSGLSRSLYHSLKKGVND
ncbi:mCG145290, partial [Mus musculus]